MINLFKYRKFAILMLIILIVSFLLSFISFWNLVLNNEVSHEGWVLIFFSVVFLAGIGLFLITFTLSDEEKISNYIDQVISAEKTIPGEDVSTKTTGFSEEETIDPGIFSDMEAELAGEKDLNDLCNNMLKSICKQIELVQGIIYVREKKGKKFNPHGTFGLSGNDPAPFSAGDGIAGQAIADKMPLRINDIPDDFVVMSGLGKSRPCHLIFQPVFDNDIPVALLEFGFFKKPDRRCEEVLKIFSSEAGKLLHNFFNR